MQIKIHRSVRSGGRVGSSEGQFPHSCKNSSTPADPHSDATRGEERTMKGSARKRFGMEPLKDKWHSDRKSIFVGDSRKRLGGDIRLRTRSYSQNQIQGRRSHRWGEKGGGRDKGACSVQLKTYACFGGGEGAGAGLGEQGAR